MAGIAQSLAWFGVVIGQWRDEAQDRLDPLYSLSDERRHPLDRRGFRAHLQHDRSDCDAILAYFLPTNLIS